MYPMNTKMKCRKCGACCIAISISSPIPGMPNGKPAGVRCIHLSDNNLCKLFGKPERPEICADYKADKWFCCDSREEAIERLTLIERATS